MEQTVHGFSIWAQDSPVTLCFGYVDKCNCNGFLFKLPFTLIVFFILGCLTFTSALIAFPL